MKQRFGAYQLDKKNFSVGRIIDTKSFTDTIHTLNSGKVDLKVKINSLPDYVSAKIIPDILKPNAKGKLILTFDAAKVGKYGPVSNKLSFEINENKNSLPFSVSAFIEKDFSKLTQKEKENAPKLVFHQKRVNTGTIKKNTPIKASLNLKNNGKSDLEIYNIFTLPDIEIIDFPTNLRPGETGTIHLSFIHNANSKTFSKPVKVYSNDFKNFESIGFIIGNVEQKESDEFSISAKELQQKIRKNGKVQLFSKDMSLKKNNILTIIDLRNKKIFSKDHIPGAINIEYNSYEYKDLIPLFTRKEITYVLYSNDERISKKAMDYFWNLDFKNVLYLENGYKDWEKLQSNIHKKEKNIPQIKKSILPQ